MKAALCVLAILTTFPIYAADAAKPLVLASQGSFFVGGETKTSKQLAGSTTGPGAGVEGDVTINQMYVQYQTPLNANQHAPVVMVHGCCLSSKTWETTPDGRMGWNEYFVRKNRSVYLADQSSRARSGFDATKINAVKLGTAPPSELPNIFMASHQTSWTLFRFGPTFNTAFPDEQFPVQAADELYKQMIPDLNGFLGTPQSNLDQHGGVRGAIAWRSLDRPFRIRFLSGRSSHDQSGGREGHRVHRNGMHYDAQARAACDTFEDPHPDHVWRPLGRYSRPLGSLWPNSLDTCNTFVKQVSDCGRRREDDVPPEDGHQGK